MKNARIAHLLLIIIGVAGYSASSVMAQAPSDAYRNNIQGVHGTARAQALGGAVGAVGADPTAVFVNPAGLGLYMRSSLSGTFDGGAVSAKTNWVGHDGVPFGSKLNDNMSLWNLSYMGVLLPRSGSRAVNINWGISMNQEYNYDRNYELVTSELKYGLSDYMAFQANLLGRPWKQKKISPLVDIARDAAFIEGYTDAKSHVQQGDEYRYRSLFGTTLRDENGAEVEGKAHLFTPLASNLSVSESGVKESFDFSLSVGINDWLYFGGALRIGNYSMYRNAHYREDFNDDYAGNKYLSHLKYNTYLGVRATEATLNLGVLAAIGDYGRVGISYRLPTIGTYNESYSVYAFSHNDSFGTGDKETSWESGMKDSSYSMLKPGQLTVSAMGFLGGYGFLSYDFQYRNLGRSILYERGSGKQLEESQFIKEDYGSEMTHRVGAEVRPWRSLAIRGGFSYTGNPMKSTQLKQEPDGGLTYNAIPSGYVVDFVLPRSYQTYSAGVGINLTKSLVLDLAYVHSVRKERAYPFTGDEGKVVTAEPIVDGKVEPVYEFVNLPVVGADLLTKNHKLVATLTWNF